MTASFDKVNMITGDSPNKIQDVMQRVEEMLLAGINRTRFRSAQPDMLEVDSIQKSQRSPLLHHMHSNWKPYLATTGVLFVGFYERAKLDLLIKRLVTYPIIPQSALNWGVKTVLYLQSLGGWLLVPMTLLTVTGNTLTYLIIIPGLYWLVDSAFGARTVLYLMFSSLANSFLKIAMHGPRPYWLSSRVRLLADPEITFGVPSHHAQGAVVLFGMIAQYLQQAWVWVGAAALALLVGLSRVYLAVHFPTDVLVGWLLGLIVLCIGWQIEAPVMAWFRQFSDQAKVFLLALASGLAVAFSALTSYLVQQNWAIPSLWLRNAMRAGGLNPFSLADILIAAGLLFGFGTGLIYDKRAGSFDRQGEWYQYAGRFVLGAAGVMLLLHGAAIPIALLAAKESTAKPTMLVR